MMAFRFILLYCFQATDWLITQYAVNRSLTDRYRRSAIPDMQRKLKQSLMEQRKLMNNIVTSEL